MRKEGDVTLIDTLTLECLQLKMSPGFDLRKEDPQVVSENRILLRNGWPIPGYSVWF